MDNKFKLIESNEIDNDEDEIDDIFSGNKEKEPKEKEIVEKTDEDIGINNEIKIEDEEEIEIEKNEDEEPLNFEIIESKEEDIVNVNQNLAEEDPEDFLMNLEKIRNNRKNISKEIEDEFVEEEIDISQENISIEENQNNFKSDEDFLDDELIIPSTYKKDIEREEIITSNRYEAVNEEDFEIKIGEDPRKRISNENKKKQTLKQSPKKKSLFKKGNKKMKKNDDLEDYLLDEETNEKPQGKFPKGKVAILIFLIVFAIILKITSVIIDFKNGSYDNEESNKVVTEEVVPNIEQPAPLTDNQSVPTNNESISNAQVKPSSQNSKIAAAKELLSRYLNDEISYTTAYTSIKKMQDRSVDTNEKIELQKIIDEL